MKLMFLFLGWVAFHCQQQPRQQQKLIELVWAEDVWVADAIALAESKTSSGVEVLRQ